MEIDWRKVNTKSKRAEKIDVHGFTNLEKRETYKEALRSATTNIQTESAQEKWNQICQITRTIGKQTFGCKTYSQKMNDSQLEELSKKKYKIRMDIGSQTESAKMKELQKELRDVKRAAKKRLNEVETQQISDKIANIEAMKNDSTRYFAALKELNNKKKQDTLVVKDKSGKTAATEEDQIRIITDYFKSMLAPEENFNDFLEFRPHTMTTPFSGEEIHKAAAKLKNGKIPGCDDEELELIKYAPIEIHQEIANILNKVAETGESVIELFLGLLRPLQKPGKSKGPTENLRPIILLSVLRKILTICLIQRTWERLKNHIPPDQAAYQPGRGTTEQVFAIKILAEKAIISQDYQIHLLLLDMSKAFDTVNRKMLLEELQEVLDLDEMYLISVLTNRPKIKVKIGNSLGEAFDTLVGIMQGDVLSAILFIFYLAKYLKHPIKTRMKGFLISPKYADDITFGGTCKSQIDEIEVKVPQKLEGHNLKVNELKTEKYIIPKPPPPPIPIPTMKTLLKHKNDKPLWSELDWVKYKPKRKDKTPDCSLCFSIQFRVMDNYINHCK